MPEEDVSYEGPEPQIYRKYSENTKDKLWKMVNDEGIKISSAAKILKVKNSTAKMILKKVR